VFGIARVTVAPGRAASTSAIATPPSSDRTIDLGELGGLVREHDDLGLRDQLRVARDRAALELGRECSGAA
jgi:hypothetical protein